MGHDGHCEEGLRYDITHFSRKFQGGSCISALFDPPLLLQSLGSQGRAARTETALAESRVELDVARKAASDATARERGLQGQMADAQVCRDILSVVLFFPLLGSECPNVHVVGVAMLTVNP